MALTRITGVKPLDHRQVEITLSTGEVIKRDLEGLLRGPAFQSIREDEEEFRKVRAEDGTLVWPGGIDLCPDTVIWGGLPPADSAASAA